MLYRVYIGLYRGSIEVIEGLRVPKIRAPVIRIRVFWGLYPVPLISRNYLCPKKSKPTGAS